MINFAVYKEYSIDEDALAKYLGVDEVEDAAGRLEALLSDGVEPEDIGAEAEFHEVTTL